MPKFGYDDQTSSLNTNELKLSNVYTNWGYLFLNSNGDGRQFLQELVDEEHGGFVMVKPQVFAIELLNRFFDEPGFQAIFDYSAVDVLALEQVYRAEISFGPYHKNLETKNYIT